MIYTERTDHGMSFLKHFVYGDQSLERLHLISKNWLYSQTRPERY